MPNSFDVVVLGGGPAGCLVGMLLARNGYSIAILDKSKTSRFCIGETLPPRASRILADLKLSDAFDAQMHRPSPGIRAAWGGAEPSTNDFLFSPYGNGWHIDRPKFNAMLSEAATRAGATFFDETPIEECVGTEAGWSVRASREDTPLRLKCRFIVDASGRRPAGEFGFPRRNTFDRLIAVAGLCAAAPGACPSDYTLIEAVDEGWFYSALLPCGDYILAYMTDGDLYATARERSSSFLEDQLAKAPYTRERVESAPPTVALFSAITSIRTTVTRRTWLAVGDAARSYDPLSGLGLCTAMNMATRAATVIKDLLEGNVTTMLDYERANNQSFVHYRTAHRAYYGVEGRWPESEFWRRRQLQSELSQELG
jgi:flavin-dependent dehydrogenase